MVAPLGLGALALATSKAAAATVPAVAIIYTSVYVTVKLLDVLDEAIEGKRQERRAARRGMSGVAGNLNRYQLFLLEKQAGHDTKMAYENAHREYEAQNNRVAVDQLKVGVNIPVPSRA